MAGQKGVKESAEAVVAAVMVAKAVKKVAKDGLQLTDLAALYAEYQSNPDLKKAVDDGLAGISAAKDEVVELDLADGLELIQKVMPAVMDFLKA